MSEHPPMKIRQNRLTPEQLAELERRLNDPKVLEGLRKDFEERTALIRECSSRGHPNSDYSGAIYSRGELKVHMHCNDCGIPYTRGPTSQEYDRFMDMMNTPFTI